MIDERRAKPKVGLPNATVAQIRSTKRAEVAMEYKDLLVIIDASHEGRRRTDFAVRLARQHNAHLLGYYVSPTVGDYVALPTSGRIGSSESGPGGLGHVVQAADLAETVQMQFEANLNANGLHGTWILSGDNIVEDIVSHIRTVDLAFIGLGDPDRLESNPQGFHPEEVILACGRPVLGLPIANLPEEVGRNVLIGWDGSRGATRAMHDALPMLKAAESVTLLAVDPAELSPASVENAVRHLRRHGIEANKKAISSGGMAVGDAVLAECDYLHADLVVAGAYGHSRLTESVLGGVSRTLLRQMMVPVLMSH
jgi:nucleotide-binding universal stress UspA family protein